MPSSKELLSLNEHQLNFIDGNKTVNDDIVSRWCSKCCGYFYEERATEYRGYKKMKHLVIITGASRGYGKALALSYTKYFANSSTSPALSFILTGRSTEELSQTQREVQAISSSVAVTTKFTDLNDLPNLSTTMASVLNEIDKDDYDEITLFQNSGSIGVLDFVGSANMTIAEITGAVNLNITSYMCLTNEFMRRYDPFC
jgi:short-subunit dehydrogenase